MRFNGKLLSAVRFNAPNVANATPHCNAYFFFLMYDVNAKNNDDYLGQGERRRKKGSRSNGDAEPCGSASVSNGLALCIGIIHAMSYSLSIVLTASNLIDIVLVTLYCTTTHCHSCHSESCANHVRNLATILAVSYSLSSSLPVPSLTIRHCVFYNFAVSLSL